MNDLDVILEFLNDSPDAQEELGTGIIKNTTGGVQVEVPDVIEDAKQGAKKKASKSSPLTKVIPKVPEVQVPTGGVGLLLMISLLIVFAIIQAPGQDISRLALIWKAFIGQAKLSGNDAAPVNKGGAAAASGGDSNGVNLPYTGGTATGTYWNPWGAGQIGN